MSECKRCYNFTAEGEYLAQGSVEKLYSSADDGCTTCGILREAIQKLLPEHPDLQTKYVAWSMQTKDRRDMLHPANSTQWELSLRVEKEPFVPDHDIQIYVIAASEFVPFRLVDVGSPEASYVRVIETPGTDAAEFRYCALSHCWGPPESITTQLSDVTYEDYKKGIPITALPKTFFDAVVFTRKLGQRYLWIDSLCIIQGNRDDWLAQGAEMCKIYENSLLTLAAASSSSGHGGLFYQPPRLEMTGSATEKSGRAYRVFARFNVTHRFFNFPLMNRAWVLQERLLSPRTLYFTHQELVWECRSCNVCQCSPVLGGFRAQMAGFPVNSKLQPAAKHLDGSALVSKWHEVVEVYTQLKLTKTSDKLMAIDGVAQYMGPIRGSRHYAGLWADSFAFDLAWTVDTFDESRSRSSEWRAPTWSWASMESKVVWQTKADELPTPEPHFSIERWPQRQRSGGIQPGSFLSLRGVLVKTTVAEADVVVNTTPCLYEDCAEWTPSDGHTRDDEPLYCLRLLESENMACSLMLRKIGRNLYQRHGLLIFNANPNNENDIWNTRDKTRSKWSPRNYQNGYPQWWTGESVSVVDIV
ncbi:hypothetical protein Hte_012318 [Hypoxylon texense]